MLFPGIPLLAVAAAAAAPLPSPPQAVVVQAYTESLCIDCKNFIDDQLLHTYRELGNRVIDLRIVPFGNAKIVDNDDEKEGATVECQHKDAECDANTWEQCAVERYPPQEYIKFIGCLETALPMGSREIPFDEDVFRKCSVGLDFGALKGCHDDPVQAWKLQKKYAELTPPEHDHVPWVLVDGNKFDEEKQDLEVEVCKAYTGKGGSHPKCSQVLKKTIQ